MSQRRTSPQSKLQFTNQLLSKLIGGFRRERREHRVFQELLRSVPGLEERLLQGPEEEVDTIADLVNFLTVRCIQR